MLNYAHNLEAKIMRLIMSLLLDQLMFTRNLSTSLLVSYYVELVPSFPWKNSTKALLFVMYKAVLHQIMRITLVA